MNNNGPTSHRYLEAGDWKEAADWIASSAARNDFVHSWIAAFRRVPTMAAMRRSNSCTCSGSSICICSGICSGIWHGNGIYWNQHQA